MIELTPLDVRKKRGDFRRGMRGFDPGEVDAFLELVAERMESLVKENMTLKERAARLQDQVREQMDREKAVQDALVTAQELRKDISGQAQREAELIKREAEAEIERRLLDAENRAEDLRHAMVELERRRRLFLKGYKQLLERELSEVEIEQARNPMEHNALELDLGSTAPTAASARTDSTVLPSSPDAAAPAESSDSVPTSPVTPESLPSMDAAPSEIEPAPPSPTEPAPTVAPIVRPIDPDQRTAPPSNVIPMPPAPTTNSGPVPPAPSGSVPTDPSSGPVENGWESVTARLRTEASADGSGHESGG